jgi:hypothetical protein
MAGSDEIGKPPIRVGQVGHEPLFEHRPFAGWGPEANAGYQSEPDASKATRQFIMLLDVCRAVGVVGGQHQFLFFGKVSPGLSGHIGARHGDAVTVVGVQCAQQAIEFLQHRLVFAVELFALRGQLLKPRPLCARSGSPRIGPVSPPTTLPSPADRFSKSLAPPTSHV